MDVEEPIFEKIAEVPYDELTDETIQEWIDVSNEYWDRDEVVVGMHGVSTCNNCDNGCCDLCGKGHTIITGVQERESGNVTNMINCTHPGRSGKFL